MTFFTNVIGIIASLISIISFVPQAYKVFKSKSTAGISLISFISLFVGSVFWLAYGWMIKSYQVLITNGFISLLTLFIVVHIIRINKKSVEL